MNWIETDKLDSFKRREFAVSFESSDEYDEFYADCKAVGIDYHPSGFFLRPSRETIEQTPPDLIVYFYFEDDIIRWANRKKTLRSLVDGIDIIPYSDLLICCDPIPIPNDLLKKLFAEI